MPQNKAINTVQLFVEGYQVDLSEGESLRNGITYGLASIQDISKKGSSQSKTITLPGTSNNNKLLNFLFDVKSSGNNTYSIPFGTAQLTNNIPGLTITDIYVDPLPSDIDTTPFWPDPTLGFDFDFPITVSGSGNFLITAPGEFIINSGSHFIVTSISGGVSGSGSTDISFHNQIPNTRFAFVTSGSTDNSGYVVMKLNGQIISTNKITAATNTYYFPEGFYQFDDILEIDFQPNYQAFAGNIGYAFDPKKKARAYVLSNNQIILSGYAKLLSATSKNGQVTYSIQITSELGGLIGALGNSRLEDLFTTIVPDLVNDPDQVLGLNKTIDLPSPFDHQLTINNIVSSWLGEVPYIWPLIDYGGNGGKGEDRSDLTSNATNFYTSVLRPCIYAKNYLDLIFASIGYTYDSNFFNSDYFENLIIPYKDGNFTLIDSYQSIVSTSGSQSLIVSSNPGGNDFSSSVTNYIFNDIESDFYEVYTVASHSYNPPNLGLYNVNAQIVGTFVVNAASTDKLLNPTYDVYAEIQVYATGSTNYYYKTSPYFEIDAAEVSFNGQFYFVSNGANISSSEYVMNFSAPVFLNEGDYIKVSIVPVAQGSTNPTVTYFPISGSSGVITGSTNLVIDTVNNPPVLNIELAPITDGQYITFKDFVPKSVSQKEYIESLVKLFNLYPVQDKDQQNHFYFYTRDEFFNDGETLDWTNKIDINSDITVKVIPELDSAKLLFSYKKDKDYYNKLYDSLYGNFSYGSLRVDTGYEFANKEKDVMKGILFAPTPIVQYDNTEYDSEGPCEILNGPYSDPGNSGWSPDADVSSTIILASGYWAANGGHTPYDAMLSDPTQNNFTGQKFTKARVGVQINYWGNQYTITKVFNDYAFQVDNGETTLYRQVTGPMSGQHRISNQFYATNDGFTYVTDNNINLPCIYESSNNNLDHKPAKSELRILYYEPLTEASNVCNAFWLQLTPTVVNGMFQYFDGLSTGSVNSGAVMKTSYPFCSHLNDPKFPTKDLLFAPPIELFYPFSGSYPSQNLFNSYWLNTVNEIVDPASRFVDCSLKLSSVDVANLNLNESIYINGTNYRINQIKDYTGDDSKLTKVELIRQPFFQNAITPPVVNAGGNQNYDIACVSNLTLNGEVITDSSVGQTLSSSLWTLVSGSGVTIASASSLITSITVAGTGSYVFNLSATDNFGLTANANTTVTIEPHNEIVPQIVIFPVSSITLPSSSVSILAATASFNCTYVSQSVWTQTQGPTATITTPNAENTTVTGLASGSYTFQLTLTDNFGGVGSASVSFDVYPATNFTVQNFIGSANITGLTGVTLSPAFTPFTGRGSYIGSDPGMTSATIQLTTDGSIPPGSFAMEYTRNSVLIASQSASDGATYTFTGVSASISDQVAFSLTTG